MKKVCACVCTRRRETITETLDSLVRQNLPSGVSFEILVVDNDPTASARSRVNAIRSCSPFIITYRIEPRRGIAFARNHVLSGHRAEWLAFIDDDEIAEPDWITQLLSAQEDYNADAVIGAVHPRFSTLPPDWIESGGYFSRLSPIRGHVLKEGNTANALVSAQFVASHNLSFDQDYNMSGGEDTLFFRQLHAAGGRIVSCPEAIVCELVPNSRANASYLGLRARTVGATYAKMTFGSRGAWEQLLVAVWATASAIGALLITTALLPRGPKVSFRYYLAFLRNVGQLQYFLGLAHTERYNIGD